MTKIATLIFLFALSLNLFPQSGKGTGRLTGIVENEKGQPLEQVRITAGFLGAMRDFMKFQAEEKGKIILENIDEKLFLKTVTNEKGKWSIAGIGRGYWKVTASLDKNRSISKIIFANLAGPHSYVVLKNNRYLLEGNFKTLRLFLVDNFSKVKDNVLTWVKMGLVGKAKNYCRKLKGERQKEAYQVLAHKLFFDKIEGWVAKGDLGRVEEFCNKQSNLLKIKCYQLTANALAIRKQYQEALRYFQRAGITTSSQARTHGLLADRYWKEGNRKLAKRNYQSSVQTYNTLIKTWDYQWSIRDRDDRFRCLMQLDKFQTTAEEKANLSKLERILELSRNYCHTLQNTFFDFLCLEQITELIPNSKIGVKQSRLHSDVKGNIDVKISTVKRNKMNYFYRLIKEGKEIKEDRALAKKNGRSKNVEDSLLLTDRYKFEKIIYGPMELLSEYWQKYYYYYFLKNEQLKEEGTVVIEAIPKSMYGGNLLFGKVWIKEKPFQVLKIEWNPKSINNFHQVMGQTANDHADPYITYFTEFYIARKGIQFPSRNYLEVGYIKEDGEKYVELVANILYNDYIFYKVDTQVQKTEMGEKKL